MALFSLMIVSCGGYNPDSKSVKICDDANLFCNEHMGIFWSDPSHDEWTWEEAVDLCNSIGGRLPTISELRTLVKNCSLTLTGGTCEVTDQCLSSSDCYDESVCICEDASDGRYSVFRDTAYFWSLSEESDLDGTFWALFFTDGGVYYDHKTSKAKVRCVP